MLVLQRGGGSGGQWDAAKRDWDWARAETMMARAWAWAWAWAWAAALVAVATAEQTRPNVVMIVVDDLGWADVGFRNGDQIRTPEIDAIRQRGLELGRYYTHTACVPSRAALMSGRFSHHHGLHNWLAPASGLGLELDNTLLSERFQSAGYATHMVGKWHLGHHTWEYLPTYRGFNSYLGLINGGGDYFLGRSYDPGHSWFHILEGTAPRCNAESCFRVAQEAQLQYSTEYFTERAVKIIDRHGSSGRKTPLFLFVAYQGVHYGGWQGTQVPQEYVSPYLETLGPGQRRQFAGMLAAVDYGIGNITRALERNGMGGDETLVVITTDNGGPVETSDAVGSRNTPFRGGKHSLYEGGVRGTCVLAGYGIKRRGTYSGLMHIADWVATLAEAASLSMHSAVPLDSLSHWSQLSAAPNDEVDHGGSSHRSPVRTSVALGNTSDHGNSGFGMLYDAPDGRQWKIIVDSAGFPDGWSKLEAKAEARELPQLQPAAAAAADGAAGSGERMGGGFGSRPCGGGFCLFELTSDPQERKDLAQDPRFARELARYKALLFQELKTFRTTARDCHKAPVSKFVEQVGPAWWPYCPSAAGRSEAHDQDLDPLWPTDDSSREPFTGSRPATSATGSRVTISVAL